MIHCELIHGDNIFTTLENEWDALASQSMTDTPFQTLAYQQSWWKNLRPAGATLHTAVSRDDSGTLLAIGCFYNHEGHLFFNGCVEETDYLDLIAKKEHAEAAWKATFEQLLQPDMPAWNEFDLCNIPSDSPTRLIVPQLAAQLGLSLNETVSEVCPIIPLPESFEAYLLQIDSKQRREIKRKLRRAKGAEATLRVVGPEDDIEQAVEDFLALLQKSTYEKRDWLNSGRTALFHETAVSALKAGTLQLMFMEVNGRYAATLFNFAYKNRIWVYNSGLDTSAFGALSLGVVISAKAIEYAIKNGYTEFDFLRGNEQYKYRFGAKDTQIFRLHITNQ